MSEVIWTVLLVGTGIGGVWIAAKSWLGWIVCAFSEFLWMGYSISLGKKGIPLAIMSILWFAVYLRNVVVSKPKS